MQNTKEDASSLAFMLAGHLMVDSGNIAARDIYAFSEIDAFTTRIPVGTYPVHLSIVTVEGEDLAGMQFIEGVTAAASIRLREEPPVRWEMALLTGQYPFTLQADQMVGYRVDSQFGCFLDVECARLLEKDRHWLRNSSLKWGNSIIEAETGRNLVFFETGYGSGVYPSYFGYSAKGEVVTLLSDFCVFGNPLPLEERLQALYPPVVDCR